MIERRWRSNQACVRLIASSAWARSIGTVAIGREDDELLAAAGGDRVGELPLSERAGSLFVISAARRVIAQYETVPESADEELKATDEDEP